MEIQYDQCALFQHMNESEVSRCLSCSGAGIQYYEKDDFIYDVLEKPAMLYVLIDGAAFVGRNHYSDADRCFMKYTLMIFSVSVICFPNRRHMTAMLLL